MGQRDQFPAELGSEMCDLIRSEVGFLDEGWVLDGVVFDAATREEIHLRLQRRSGRATVSMRASELDHRYWRHPFDEEGDDYAAAALALNLTTLVQEESHRLQDGDHIWLK